MSKFIATSYGYPVYSFIFNDLEEYEDKAEEYKICFDCEEWQIEVLESDTPQCYQDKINQNNIEFWLDNEDDVIANPIAAEFLIGLGGDWQDNIEQYLDDVCIYSGKISDYAEELAEECTPESERGDYWEYIDWERVAQDGVCGSDYIEIQSGEWVVNANDF